MNAETLTLSARQIKFIEYLQRTIADPALREKKIADYKKACYTSNRARARSVQT